MGWVRVTNVLVRNENPSGVLSDLKFEVSFVTEQDLQAPLVWRLVYVGCADDTSKDQELELIEIGPLKKGALRFNFESDPPDFTLIDPNDVWGTTVILLEASYKDQEFVRVGWYVHNYYPLQQLQDDPPDIPLFDHMNRYIVAGKHSCLYVHMYACTYVCIHMYVHMYACMYLFVRMGDTCILYR